MSVERALGIGIVGLGFMGRTHARAYGAAARAGRANRIVALCDRDPRRFEAADPERGNLAPAGEDRPPWDADARRYDDANALFADPAVNVVSICTTTPTHVDLALRALAARKHVLVEKPVALSAADVERLAAAVPPNLVCMPAMCMRYWPGWTWLAERVRERTFGHVRSASFRRLSAAPGWSRAFYGDTARSGAALYDLHVHDADFVRWCFGAPRAVFSAGSPEHVTTSYLFDDGPAHVVAEGGWDQAPGFAFRMGYTVAFEHATADFALAPEPRLVLTRAGDSERVALAAETGYEGEVRHLLDGVTRGTAAELPTLAEAVALTRMLAAEAESARRGRVVEL